MARTSSRVPPKNRRVIINERKEERAKRKRDKMLARQARRRQG